MRTLRAERTISDAQRRKIFMAACELGWSDELLHQELERVVGASSLRQLSRAHARLFIDYQVSLGATSGFFRAVSSQVAEPRPRPQPANLVLLATPAQWALIDELLAALGFDRQTPYFLGGLKRSLGVTRIRTRREASVAIEFLKSVLARRKGQPAESAQENGEEPRAS